jgi:GntR family transcriptional regulator
MIFAFAAVFLKKTIDKEEISQYNVYNVYIQFKGEHMDIIISNSKSEPIYEQIYEQIKSHIMSGKLRAGDALPSMRLLAQELRISVITTKRAYEELERDGFIESYTGKGSFVKAQNAELLREENLRQTEELLSQACRLAQSCGISADELKAIIDIIYGGE